MMKSAAASSFNQYDRKCVFFVTASVSVLLVWQISYALYRPNTVPITQVEYIFADPSRTIEKPESITTGNSATSIDNKLKSNTVEVFTTITDTNMGSKVGGNKIIRVLILAYHRSGSTLTGSLFDDNDDTFYDFEPLYAFYERSMKSNSPLKYLNGSELSKPSKNSAGLLPFAKSILTKVFDCRFAELDVNTIFLKNCPKECHSCSLMCSCIRSKTRFKALAECLPDYTKLCLQSRYRVIKTIRFRMDSVESLLQTYPDLKIIHLLRDPRGRVCSSQISHKCKVEESFVKELCDEGSRDISDRLELKQIYPDSFKEVIYEDLVADPEGIAKSIFEFIGTEFPEKIKRIIKAKIEAKKQSGPYGTYRKNGLETAYKWSRTIPWNVMAFVNRHCRSMIEHARFPIIKNQKDLENFQIPNRVNLSKLHD